jgi:hypothetical protein
VLVVVDMVMIFSSARARPVKALRTRANARKRRAAFMFIPPLIEFPISDFILMEYGKMLHPGCFERFFL